MAGRRPLPILLLLALLLTSLTLSAEAVRMGDKPRPVKVAPAVWGATRYGQQTQFLIVLNAQADLDDTTGFVSRQARLRHVYNELVEIARRTQAPLRQWLDQQAIPYRPFYIVNALLVEGGREIMLPLSTHPAIKRIEANPHITRSLPQPLKASDHHATAVSSVEANITYTGAEQVWAKGYTGQGIVIGAQDTGYQWDHPALIRQYRGWDGTDATHDYHWHDAIHELNDSNNRCGVDSPEPCDDFGHGTHTLGTAVGWDGGSNRIGMAPDAEWIGCRNMDNGTGRPSTYLECFEFFLAPYPIGGTFEEDGRPELAPHVTLNSWSCPPSEGCAPETLRDALRVQRAAGIMTVVAAGNSGPECSTITDPPAHYGDAYTVGALAAESKDGRYTPVDQLAAFSSRGPVTVDGSQRLKPDLVAPGMQVRSSLPPEIYGPMYGSMSGTSMAAPHVAGAVALLWSAQPDLIGDIELTRHYLDRYAFSIPLSEEECGSSGNPNHLYGHGRLDIATTVQQALLVPRQYLPVLTR